VPSAEVDAFRQGLRALGYIEGQNTTMESRFAGGQVERLPELASELARLKVDVIVTSNTPSAMAAKAATSTIPIVFASLRMQLAPGSSPTSRVRVGTSPG
jgi:putative ABC transport system substrate-binding protein